MTARPRNHSSIVNNTTSRRSPLWIHASITILALTTGQHCWAEHFVDAAAQRVVGCLNGQCSPPVSPWGHYRPSWRRWPNAKDTPVVTRPNGLVPFDPIVPDEVDENRTQSRSRSDRPLDPEDMGAAAGMSGGLNRQPVQPRATGSFDPFNTPSPQPTLPSPAATERNSAPSSDPIFSSPAEDDQPAEDNGGGLGGGLFDTPITPSTPADNGDADSDTEVDLFNQFNQSGTTLDLPTQLVRRLGKRSIKSRGVSLQAHGKLTTARVLTPAVQTRDTADTAKISLASYSEPSRPEAADVEPVAHKVASPRTGVVELSQTQLQGSPRLSSRHEAALQESLSVNSDPWNPLRASQRTQPEAIQTGGTQAEPSGLELVEVQHSKPENSSAEAFTELTYEAVEHQSTTGAPSQAVANEPVRETIRRNPLR